MTYGPAFDRGECLLQLPCGAVQGLQTGAVQHFFGIPYAEPPVGPLRFALPQTAVPWSGIRDTRAAGPNAPQRVNSMVGLDVEPLVGAGWAAGDDYLTLNLWRPVGSASPLPIMVFIHGGGFVLGSKDVPVQDGATFARDGVICIAINYRLGIEGFLPIPGAPTNLGLRDMIAALRWVQANAAAFNGDPCNVTVFGESAGAMAISNLLTSPLAAGLFHRAIIQSGHGAMTRDTEVAQRLVEKLASVLGITPDLAGFHGVPPEEALDAIDEVSLPTADLDLRDGDGREPVFGISRFIPVHGDDVLPRPSLKALAAGVGAEVDVLIGTNAEEMNLYLVPTRVRDDIGRAEAINLLARSLPAAREVLEAYGLDRGRTPGQALADALTDLVFRWPARRFAEEHQGRIHMYEFEWHSPAFGGELGAAHAVEMPFVFDTLASVTGPEGLCGDRPPQALADRVHAIWVRFATDGSLPWPAFDFVSRQVYLLQAGRAIHDPIVPAAAFLP